MVAEPIRSQLSNAVSDRGAAIAASKIGCTVEEYREHEAKDDYWCKQCRRWLPFAEAIPLNPTGRGGRCIEHASAYYRERYRRQVAEFVVPQGIRARSWVLAPEGFAARGLPARAVNPDPHALCPAVLGCREGRLPWGWIKAGGAA